MVPKEFILREIESLPQNLLEEVADFIGYLKLKNGEKNWLLQSPASIVWRKTG
jgi:hypothetical protein